MIELEDVKLIEPKPGTSLCQAFSGDLGDKIAVPSGMDLSEFSFEESHCLLVTPMKPAECKMLKEKNGEFIRWKLAFSNEKTEELTHGGDDSRKDLEGKPSYKAHGAAKKKKRDEPLVARVGIVVGQSPIEPAKHFVWTPEAPASFDGVLWKTADTPEFRVGDWIRFKITGAAAKRILVGKSRERFQVVSFEATKPLFKSWRKGSTIEMEIHSFPLCNTTRQEVDGVVSLMDFEVGLLSDPERMTDPFYSDNDKVFVNIIVHRRIPRNREDTVWVVISARPSTSPPLHKKKRETTQKPRAVSSTTSINITRTIHRNPEKVRGSNPSGGGRVHVSLGEEMSDLSLQSTESFSFTAFVEASKGSQAFLWTVDSQPPQQSMMRGRGRLSIGDFIRGVFTRQNDGRFVCRSFELCPPPDDCVVTNRKGHAVVRTCAFFDTQTRALHSKYLGEVIDSDGLLPSDACDQEKFSLLISKKKSSDGIFRWNVELVH